MHNFRTRLFASAHFVFALGSRQATNTVEELLFNEEIYIRSLGCGIDGYMKRFEQKQMPIDLRGQQFRVFGNIHRIRDFHETEFFPALRRCEMSIVKICRTFCEFIEVSGSADDEQPRQSPAYHFLFPPQKDYFYIYILYAINRQRSEKFCELHRAYFKDIQNEIGDKLGINSFLVQPIQRLPKYKILLGQLISELGKRLEDDGVKEKIAACCLAEKRVQRLLDTVNGSMNINDIVDCYEVRSTLAFCFIGLYPNEFLADKPPTSRQIREGQRVRCVRSGNKAQIQGKAVSVRQMHYLHRSDQ